MISSEFIIEGTRGTCEWGVTYNRFYLQAFFFFAINHMYYIQALDLVTTTRYKISDVRLEFFICIFSAYFVWESKLVFNLNRIRAIRDYFMPLY